MRTQKKNKVISGHFNLPEHSVVDLKITALGKQNFHSTTEQEMVEFTYIKRFQAISKGFNKESGFLIHYNSQLKRYL